jgi:hypothetical protein
MYAKKGKLSKNLRNAENTKNKMVSEFKMTAKLISIIKSFI